MSNIYFNTTAAPAAKLKTYTAKAKTQNDRIAEIFRRNPNKDLAASDIFTLFSGVCPITSIRRALNTLEKYKTIQKTGKQKVGPWGRPENTYKALIKQGVLFLLLLFSLPGFSQLGQNKTAVYMDHINAGYEYQTETEVFTLSDSTHTKSIIYNCNSHGVISVERENHRLLSGG